MTNFLSVILSARGPVVTFTLAKEYFGEAPKRSQALEEQLREALDRGSRPRPRSLML